MQKKRKPNYILWLFLLVAALSAGYLISGLYTIPNLSVDNYESHLTYIFKHPFDGYFNDKTKGCIALAFLLWAFAFGYYILNVKNYMIGKEYGTTEWADIKAFNKKYADYIKKKRSGVSAVLLAILLLFSNEKISNKNRILSQKVRMSYDADQTHRNNNMVVVGAPGTGKTAFVLAPNLFQGYGSNVYTDPKGGLVEDYGNYLLQMGRVVKVLNLCEMEKSLRYNPFNYIRKPSDISKLITNLISNTTPAESHTQDPFWEKAETLYLKSIFNYVWMECPRNEIVPDGAEGIKTIHLGRNFRTVLHLLDEAEVTEGDQESKLTKRMNRLAEESSLKDKHPAVRSYFRCIRGAGDTVRSIIVSANARFDPFDDEELLRILDDDDIDLRSLGTGVDGDGQTLTSLFIVIPDDDDTYNFIPGMLYTQMFQELYAAAREYGGKLPIDVGCWFDEFKNIKMPATFDKIIATCRSRGIYCTVFVQGITQLKELYHKGDAWEGIIGCCDTLLYLGGKEPSTHKYLSENMGKWTIDKRTTGETTGTHGSGSRNWDVLGRELMTTDEIERMDDDFGLCLVRGELPIMDKKWRFYRSKEHRSAKKLGKYTNHPIIKKEGLQYITVSRKSDMNVLTDNGIEYYKRTKEKVKFYEMDYETFLTWDFSENMEVDYQEIQTVMNKNAERIKNQEELIKKNEAESISPDEILMQLITSGAFTKAQEEQILEGLRNGLNSEQIIKYANPKYSVERMSVIRKLMEQSKAG